MATHISQALAFAHHHQVMHRNITARHVLWRTSDQTAKLADLGLANAWQGYAALVGFVKAGLSPETLAGWSKTSAAAPGR